MTTHAYVEWRTPLSYVLPGLRSITGGYRSGKVDRSFGPNLLQGGATSW
jgi:HlyD family secretion protein